ncbi:MAG: hypothetical protein WCL70_02520 [Paludibacter sp.]
MFIKLIGSGGLSLPAVGRFRLRPIVYQCLVGAQLKVALRLTRLFLFKKSAKGKNVTEWQKMIVIMT